MHAETQVVAKLKAAIEVIPSGGVLGAKIRGISLRHMDERSSHALEQPLFEHLVVVIRAQPLSDPELIS